MSTPFRASYVYSNFDLVRIFDCANYALLVSRQYLILVVGTPTRAAKLIDRKSVV